MDGLEKIREKVKADTQSRVSEILGNAQRQKEKMLEEAELKNAQIRESNSGELKILHEQDERRLASEINMEKRKIELQAKNRLLEESKSQAEQKLRSLDDEKKLEFYLSLLESETLDGDIVYLSENDLHLAETLKTKCSKDISFSKESSGNSGGLLIRRDKITLDLSFAEILKQVADEAITELAGILYAEK